MAIIPLKWYNIGIYLSFRVINMGEFENSYHWMGKSSLPKNPSRVNLSDLLIDKTDRTDKKESEPLNITLENVAEIAKWKSNQEAEKLKYDGEGDTSYMGKYDSQKRDYLERLGMIIPEDMGRPELITVFNFVRNMIHLATIYEENIGGGDLGKKYIEDQIFYKNKFLQDKRIDHYGNRDISPITGKTSQEVAEEVTGHKSNVEQKVSVFGYNAVLEFTLYSLSVGE